jgi:hypothetical protein
MINNSHKFVHVFLGVCEAYKTISFAMCPNQIMSHIVLRLSTNQIIRRDIF